MNRLETLIKDSENKLKESFAHCVDLSKWVHSAMNKEQKQVQINKYKKWIKDLEES